LGSTSLTGRDELATLVFTEEENLRLLTTSFQLVRDGSAPYRPLKEYFQESAKHFQDVKNFQKDSPSPGEVELMRQRWMKFVEGLHPIIAEYGGLQGNILGRMNVRKMPGLADEIKKRNAEATDPSNTSTATVFVTRKVITDIGESPDAASKVNPPFSTAIPPVSKVPWWRVLWRRIISGLKRKGSR
jgi:hypothetical protein